MSDRRIKVVIRDDSRQFQQQLRRSAIATHPHRWTRLRLRLGYWLIRA